MDLQKQVARYFQEVFGTTPLTQRLDDIRKETNELCNYSTVEDLRSEFGDLLASVLAGINECGFDATELIKENERKIFLRRDQYKALGRKSSVAILGGAFNPVTLGHIAVAQFLLKVGIFDEVWLTPCYAHMYSKEMASPEHRLEMCNIAAQVDPRIKVFDYEIEHQLAGETYHFVKRLQDEDFAKNNYNFSIVIGMDNANTFDKWVNYRDLERLIRFVVVPRAGETPDPSVNWYMQNHHILLRPDKDELPDTSSTEARDILDTRGLGDDASARLEVLRSARRLLDPKVIDYIQEKRLYHLFIPSGEI